jgi:predicted dienelactone hydrolase
VAPDHVGNTLFDASPPSDDTILQLRLGDLAYVTNEMIRRNADPSDFLYQSFEPTRIAWTGHSFGASTVLLRGATDDTEIVNVPLAPRIDPRMHAIADPPQFALNSAFLVIGGSGDHTCDFPNQQTAYDKTVGPKFLVELDGAKHFDFTELCGNQILTNAITQIGSECNTNPDGRYFNTINYFVTAAMNRYLRCNTTAAPELSTTSANAQQYVKLFSATP